MRVFSTVLFCFLISCSESLSGQCPVRDSVLKMMGSLPNFSSTGYSGELKQLLKYDRGFKNCAVHADSVYTSLLLRIGVLYFKLADYERAVQYTLQAFQIIQTNRDNPAINKTCLVKYYFYLSIYYDSLKMPAQKNEAIDSCISNELGSNSDYHYTSLVLEDNVKDLYNKGDYNRCADRATLGETLIHKYFLAADSMNHIIYFIYYKANALRSLKKFYEEEQFLQSKQAEFLKSRDKNYVGVIYRMFGYLYESRRDYAKAIIFFRKAYYYDMFSSSKEMTAGVLSEIGEIYSERFNQNRTALQYYKKALGSVRNITLADVRVTDSFYILGNIGNVYARMKLFDSAFHFYQMAFDKIKPGINETGLVLDIENFVNANTVESVIKLVLDKANACLQQFHYNNNPLSLQQALSIYKTADQLLIKIKDEQAEIQSRLFWQMDVHSLYEHAIEAAYLQNNYSDAFYFFEKSRAVILNDQLNQQNKITGKDIFKLAQLKKKILLLERERDVTELSSNRYIEVQKGLMVQNQALERLEQTVKKLNPLYYQSSLDTSFISVSDVQKYILKDHQGLLEMFSGDSANYSLLITGQRVFFNKISKAGFDSTAGAYISFLSDPALLNSQFENYIRTAHHLYQLIFQNNPVPDGRIIISPDGHIFPMEALVTKANTGSPSYFLNNHSVSYTYSARYLLTRFASDTITDGGNFLGVAPVHYSSASSLAALQGSDLSLIQIGSYFRHADNLIAAEASRNNFLQKFSGFKIIQLYTHASDSSDQGEPVIYFADSTLYLSDLIPENKPQTRLIVLSACETGIGKLYEGEGVFSFNRGFAILGIPASITNLWAVDNESTYRITELFYKYLSGGMPFDMALQKAKLEFFDRASKENKLPYFWAATILAGKSDAIKFEKKYPWKDSIIIISLTGLFFLGWKQWGRRRN